MVNARDFYKTVKVKDPVTGKMVDRIEVRDEFKQPPLREQIRTVNRAILKDELGIDLDNLDDEEEDF